MLSLARSAWLSIAWQAVCAEVRMDIIVRSIVGSCPLDQLLRPGTGESSTAGDRGRVREAGETFITDS